MCALDMPQVLLSKELYDIKLVHFTTPLACCQHCRYARCPIMAEPVPGVLALL